EEAAAKRPADQERRLDPRTVVADLLVLDIDLQQLGDEWDRHEHVQVHVQAVEQPAQPGGGAGLPLLRRKVAQARRFGAGRAGGRTSRAQLSHWMRRLPGPGTSCIDTETSGEPFYTGRFFREDFGRGSLPASWNSLTSSAGLNNAVARFCVF